MTGEPVSLDLGDAPAVGHATVRVPIYPQSDDPNSPTATYTAPKPTAQTAPIGVYPPAPAATKTPSEGSILDAAVREYGIVLPRAAEPQQYDPRSATTKEPGTVKEAAPARDFGGRR